MSNKKGKKKKKRRRLNKKRFIASLIIFIILVLFTYYIFNVNITNIYIKGNDYLSDQQIIDMSNLESYPKSIFNLTYKIKEKLEENDYVLSAKVKKNLFLNKIYITIEENYPLFYYQVEDKTVLYNGEKKDDRVSTITIINKIPDTVYDKFIEKMRNVDKKIFERMSEIEYKPNEVDEERFFVLMNDGNYIYLTINKFLTVNKYLDMINSFGNKKGILYLDSGEYFDIFDE